MKNKHKPEIRFPGFSGEWEHLKADEIFHSISDKNHANLPVLSASQEKGMVYRAEIGIDIKYDEKSTKNYKRVLPGQFVIHLRSFQGGFAFSSIAGITSPAYTVLDFKNKEKYYSLFWRYVLASDTFIKRLETVTYGIRDGRSISFSDFSTLKFRVPSYNEQIKIGNFLKQLDDTIALQQQELNTLKQTKQGFLQKMFPKEGESVPEIRFPGFTGDWEQRKFQDCISKAGKKNTMGENYSAYSVSNKLGLVSQTEQFDGSRLDDLDKTSYKLVNPNEFAYNPARINVGSIAFNNLNKTVIVSSLYVVLKMNEELDNEFILQFIKSQFFIDEVRRNTEGSVREYLFFENFKNIKFPYTSSKDEQIKIGNFFKQLDDTIALHQRELDALKETKKAFLQKMFV
ncbi:restriction endonuclease subunit S [Bacillus toyonensis]|uniref:restriction endonuclease subunit S n=1 Tax=Bacillus toyonensis TaxID=155322 RepID=UPI000BFE443F|nr:restriction endonuclease subunit S [Bacillus toyonensis]PHE31221.1 restriction endonuclease [Bacillus toyonensis]